MRLCEQDKMGDELCFYEVLQVSRDAELSTIKKQYRKLAKRFHPDKNPGDKEAEDMFKLIAEAYEVLSDPSKRREYDRYGRRGLGGQAGFRAAHNFDMADAHDLFRQFFGNEMGQSGFMSSFFDDDPFFNSAGGSRTRRRPSGGRDIDPFGGFGSSAFFGQSSMFGGAADDFFGVSSQSSQRFSGARGGQFTSFSSSFSSSSGADGVTRSVKTTTTMKNGERVTTKETTTTYADGRVERRVDTDTHALDDSSNSRRKRLQF